jgi:hypothetical protein
MAKSRLSIIAEVRLRWLTRDRPRGNHGLAAVPFVVLGGLVAHQLERALAPHRRPSLMNRLPTDASTPSLTSTPFSPPDAANTSTNKTKSPPSLALERGKHVEMEDVARASGKAEPIRAMDGA